MALQNELLELSAKVDAYLQVVTVSEIHTSLELSDDISLPYTFTAEVLQPGTFKGITLTREEIVKAKDTIFMQNGNFPNYEINKDHRGNRKQDSTVDDLIGKVVKADYDYTSDKYVLSGEIYDMPTALKVKNNILKYLSLRIDSQRVDNYNGKRYAKGLEFQELSFVRAPGNEDVRIIRKD